MPEPIAIIGSSCRFAGNASSPTRLWDLLSNPTDLSREVPENRFNAKAFYHPDGEYHGTTNSIKAYWLEQDHRVFDAGFFSIAPKEAEAIDPQQRLLLEVVYEAMESSGYTMPQCAGKDIAVFAGVMTADYDTLSQRDELSASQYYATGNARSMISNRLSYFFDFRGPSVTIDTACSASLVALHQAVQSLRSGESSVACVTGVNLMLTPEQFIVESSLHMLSPMGKCHMWDADADGYARGEGVAALFLKPLSAALESGDEIQAIIRETGVNSDGRTPGITMPSSEAQAALIKQTYRKAGLNLLQPSDQCQYFEAHGTGTQAGDPKEAEAIHSTFFGTAGAASDSRKLLVGSVKTVIGHTEGAAGLAGVLKVVQAMKHGVVPPNLHLSKLNSRILPFYQDLEVPTTSVPWPEPAPGHPRRASVNSFGFGGTNSHAIIEAYTPHIHDVAVSGSFRLSPRHIDTQGSIQTTQIAPNDTFYMPLFLSASSKRSLKDVAGAWGKYINDHPDVSVAEVGWNLLSRRTVHSQRVSISVSSREQAIEALGMLSNIKAESGDIGVRSTRMTEKPRILGVFTGQGAQWPSMSRCLLLSNKTYRRTIRALDKVLSLCHDPPPWTLEAEILASAQSSRVNEAAVCQPLCTAIQIGLVDVLKSVGVEFHTVVGHSSGEIAAAYAAGRLTAGDAILIAYYRGLYTHLAGGGSDGNERGGMMAVGMSEHDAVEFCRDSAFGGELSVAANNAPSSVTLSGSLRVINLAHEKLKQRGLFVRVLKVDTAYHSPHMQRPAREYLKALERCIITPSAVGNAVSWFSSVYDTSSSEEIDLSKGYWADNMLYTVKLYNAVESAMRACRDFDCAIEVGPHHALKGPVTQTAKATLGATIPYAGVLERFKDDTAAFSNLLGFLWSNFGPVSLNMSQWVKDSPDPSVLDRRLKDLPSYPWDHSSTYYRESRISHQYHFKNSAPHELLGVRTRDDNKNELRWRNILRTERIPWVQGHRFQGECLVPASAYLVMALDAASSLTEGISASVVEIRDLNIMSGISMEADSAGVEVLFSLKVFARSNKAIHATFDLASCPADGSTAMKVNVSGNLFIRLGEPSDDALPRADRSESEMLPADPEAFYHMMSGTGLLYTGPFKSIQKIQRRFNYSLTSLKWRHEDDSTTLSVSPATLDSCLQSAFLTYASPGDKSLWTAFLPSRISLVRFNLAAVNAQSQSHTGSYSADEDLTISSYLTSIVPPSLDSKTKFSVDLCVANIAGATVVQIEELTVSALANTRSENDHEMYLHTVTDVDPSDAIVDIELYGNEYDHMLVESCERVASFYIHQNQSQQQVEAAETAPALEEVSAAPWDDTQLSVDTFVTNSPYRWSLERIVNVGKDSPRQLLNSMPSILQQSQQDLQFRQYLERIVKQITHKYSRMNVLSIANPDFPLHSSVLAGLGTSFISYTAAVAGSSSIQIETGSISGRFSTTSVDRLQDLRTQLEPQASYDLMILSSSIIKARDGQRILGAVRELMTDGGFLIIVDHDFGVTTEADVPELSETPSVNTYMEKCGFQAIARNSDQLFASGYSVSIRQAYAPFMRLLTDPLDKMPMGVVVEDLVIMGGADQVSSQFCARVAERLARFCGAITILDYTSSEPGNVAVAKCTAAIVLVELEESILMSLTDPKLELLRELLKPEVQVLWLTRDARADNCESAATLGFTRTMPGEIPGLKMQVLDLESPSGTERNIYEEDLIAETFVQLVMPEGGVKNALWTRESEIYIENGRRVVPRVMPLKENNNRHNAIRRVLSSPINTANTVTGIVGVGDQNGHVRFKVNALGRNGRVPGIPSSDSGRMLLQVRYSSTVAVKHGGRYMYICTGTNMLTGQRLVAISAANASYVEVDVPHTCALEPGTTIMDECRLIQQLMKHSIARAIAEEAQGRNILLVEPHAQLLKFARHIVAPNEEPRSSHNSAAWKLRQTAGHLSTVSGLHPLSSGNQLASIFPVRDALIYDFLPQDDDLSKRVRQLVPSHCQYQNGSSLISVSPDCSTAILEKDAPQLDLSVLASLTNVQKSFGPMSSDPSHAQLITVAELTASRISLAYALDKVIDWRADRSAAEIVPQHPCTENLLSPEKTYILVGLTRDLGQSLCRLFLAHGGRHVVLSSRNPPDTSPKWVRELSEQYGARIRIERLDVTDLAAVRAFRVRLLSAESEDEPAWPPVGGVVNGAMVLLDRVFAQMTAETWHSVLAPKTIGSHNLDVVFSTEDQSFGGDRSNDDLDFFIMTSSFAAIGGHAAQSNYAAANMYMNGVAESRRRRGLAASVLNVGAIYGLGLLQRQQQQHYEERDQQNGGSGGSGRLLYAGLERDGYPPISERDVHHMFLEAIVAGRPGSGKPIALTTGLARFDWDQRQVNPLYWHLDPRFCHYYAHHDNANAGAGSGSSGSKALQGNATASLRDQLAAAAAAASPRRDAEAAARLIVAAFAARLESALQLPPGSVTPNHGVAELGVDSLVAVEMRNWLWRALGRDVAVLKILGATSVYRLCLDIAQQIVADVQDVNSISSIESSDSKSSSSKGETSVSMPSSEDGTATSAKE
ncbi:hypothetical protein BX600DRAFT_518575 [Xylariales sp. PMI_506]|nr:hypothetical protein BX600DRAFT_518575 [Xylariales sp. PMI_506]